MRVLKSLKSIDINIVMSGVTILIACVYLLRPLYDPDFYWHLKTGEWIWRTKALLAADPFTIPPHPPVTPRTEFIMNSYWLFQLVMYAFYSLFGLSGIALLRLTLVALLLGVMTRWSTTRNSMVFLAMSLGCIQVFDAFPSERPQFVSFVCFSFYILCIHRLMHPRDPDKALWKQALPLVLLMAVWSNLHGGYFVGQVLLLLIVMLEGCKFVHPALEPLPRAVFVRLVTVVSAALAASCINPYPVAATRMLLTVQNSNNFIYTTNLEYFSLAYLYRQLDNHGVLINMLFIASVFIVFVSSRYRRDITWLGLLSVTAYMGCSHIRYLPFFLIAGTFFLIMYFDGPQKRRFAVYLVTIVSIVVCGYSLNSEAGNLKRTFREGLVPTSDFPVEAADFILQNGLKGNLYNRYVWGGYLLWRLGPDIKVFCDGRQIDPKRTWEWLMSETVPKETEPSWKKLFETYSIETALIPVFGTAGSYYPLFGALRSDQDWKLVFIGKNAAVFRRKSPVQQTN